MSRQGLRQQTVRDATGTALSYEGDWHSLFDDAEIPEGDFNGRLLAWINDQLEPEEDYTELNGAMYAFAIARTTDEAKSWSELGEFTIT